MVQGSTVHLMWNKHQDTMVSMFDALLDSDKLTDCTISVEGKCLRAHKIILSACSPYFEELFTVNYEKHPIIILHDVKYSVIKALIDFMYRGEVNVPQCELSGLLKLSESLKIRGLSGSKCAEDVNMQKDSESNQPPFSPRTLQSEPASVRSFIPDQNVSEDRVQSFRGCSSAVASQAGCSSGVDSKPDSIQKYKKCAGSDQRMTLNAFQEVISPDLDSEHELPPQRQVLPTTCNSTGGPVFTPIPCQSVSNELKSPGREMAVAENVQFTTPERVLDDKISANESTHQQEISLKTKSEVLESHMEIVEDLTLDDGDDDYYYGGDNYHGDCNSGKDSPAEGFRVNERLAYEENFHSQDSNSVSYLVVNKYLNNMTMSTSKQYSCPTCGKSYRYPAGLGRHMKYECGKEPQFQCPRCKKRCFRSDHLRTHMATRRCMMQEK